MVGIYKITNLINNKVYIGQSVNIKKRIADHKYELNANHHCNSHLQNSYNKYRKDAFEFNIICECEESELDELECYYIKYYDSTNRLNGYNKESGGSLNKHISEETRQNMRENRQGEKAHMFGKKHSEETKAKMRQIALGRVLSEEHKKKLSDAHKGKNAKQFYCPELDMIFIGTLSAAKYLGLKSSSCIFDCIAGRKKSAGKHPTTGEPLHWMYLKDKLS